MGKLQNEDFKTEAEITGAGGSASQLLNDTKIYVTALSLNKTLDDAITAGDFASGVTPSQVRLTVGNGFGSTNTKIRRFTNTVENSGSHITYTDSATNGASFTINTAGIYAITYTEEGNTGTPLFGITLNSSQLTTDINGVTVSDILTISNCASGNGREATACTVKLAVNDVIRMHTNNGTATFADNVQVFSIVGPL